MKKKVTGLVCTIIAATLLILSLFCPAVICEMFGIGYTVLFAVAIIAADVVLLLIAEVCDRKRKIRRRLKRKGMPYQTTDYMDMECIDPESRTPVKHSTVKRAAPESVVLKKEKGLDD